MINFSLNSLCVHVNPLAASLTSAKYSYQGKNNMIHENCSIFLVSICRAMTTLLFDNHQQPV